MCWCQRDAGHLFEASFLSNSDDERRLDATLQQTTANAIVDAVETWLERHGPVDDFAVEDS